MSKFWSFLTRQSSASPARPGATVQSDAQARAPQDPEERVIAIIRRECPAFSPADMQTPFDRLGIDSVGMLMIHTAVEEVTNDALDSRQWDQIVTPVDLVKALRAASPDRSQLSPEATAERRSCMLNMPQMALGGLSEHWLLKELGDMHWTSLTNAFARPSHMLRDEEGERIYATFARIRIEATCPFADFEENERIDLSLSMSRHGAGMFFGEVVVEGAPDRSRRR